MTACSRRCASSLLALSALLLAGCGGSSPDRVERAFAAQGIGLSTLQPHLRNLRGWGLWPMHDARVVFWPARDDSAVLSIVVFPGAGDAAIARERSQKGAPGFVRITQVGTAVVFWDANAGPAAEAALRRALAALR